MKRPASTRRLNLRSFIRNPVRWSWWVCFLCFVLPTDDLRERTLEVVRSCCRIRYVRAAAREFWNPTAYSYRMVWACSILTAQSALKVPCESLRTQKRRVVQEVIDPLHPLITRLSSKRG